MARRTGEGALSVAMQVAFASVVGLGCAGLMARTRSGYPAMLLHAVVNAVVVFGS